MKEKKRLNEEVRTIMSTAFITALSLLMALTWKDAIAKYATDLSTLSPFQGSLVSAIIISVIGVIGILIITHYFRKE